MTPTKIHLVVLIHGMWGDPTNLSAMEATIKEKYVEPNNEGEELNVLLAETNKTSATYDGMDWGGERVADEVGHNILCEPVGALWLTLFHRSAIG